MKRNNLFNFCFLILSSFLLSLSHPSLLSSDGLSFFAWFSYIPFFLLCRRISSKASFLWGFFYGAITYVCLCWWISSFGFVAISFVSLLYAFYYGILFFIIVFADKHFPDKYRSSFWIFRVFIILTFDFLRTHGIFAFAYGIIGYSQWKNPLMLTFSSFFGLWGVDALILFVNSILEKIIFEKNLRSNIKKLAFVLSFIPAAFFLNLIPHDDSSGKKISLALIQNASSAPSYSISQYEKDAQTLKELSLKALEENPQCDLIVWPETAVVPSILANLNNQKDQKRKNLANDLYHFIKSQKNAFLIGNNHPDSEGNHNAAVFFTPEAGEVDLYYKNHLVPFTEYWPSFLDFKFLDPIKGGLNCDFFTPGKEIKVFKVNDLNFSVPICFEDSFSPLVRKMKKSGAQFLVNISDDAWSGQEAARNMHLSMSTFRCAEYGIPMARSTIDGKSCIIDFKGKVISQIQSQTDSYLLGQIKVKEKTSTLYFFTGDFFIIFISSFTILSLLILSLQFVKVDVLWQKKNRKKI